MKKLFLIVLALGTTIKMYAQNDSLAMEMSKKLADRLKDSLLLTDLEREQLYSVNMNIHIQKREVRNNYSQSPSLQYFLQGVENLRDSMYRKIIDEEKFQLYLLRKKTLIKSN